MKATFEVSQLSEVVNYDGSKDRIEHIRVVCMDNGELVDIVDCRIYASRSRNASTIYCDLWVQAWKHGTQLSASGKAGGWGYCKRSSSVADAIKNCGIELWGCPYDRDNKLRAKQKAHIGGCGMSSVNAALLAIAKAARTDKRKFWIV